MHAALTPLTQHGVSAVSRRAVAQQAGVPLPATTYYFTSLDTLLEAAVGPRPCSGTTGRTPRSTGCRNTGPDRQSWSRSRSRCHRPATTCPPCTTTTSIRPLPRCDRDLRHGAATLAVAGGADLDVVSEMLGHSTIAITADTDTS